MLLQREMIGFEREREIEPTLRMGTKKPKRRKA
jgi:hypothetical protein